VREIADDEGRRLVRIVRRGSGPVVIWRRARIEQLYAIADRKVARGDGDPQVVFCVDEFGPAGTGPR